MSNAVYNHNIVEVSKYDRFVFVQFNHIYIYILFTLSSISLSGPNFDIKKVVFVNLEVRIYNQNICSSLLNCTL